jgi:hypothetical protein
MFHLDSVGEQPQFPPTNVVIVDVGGGEVHVVLNKKMHFCSNSEIMSAHITLNLDSSEEFIKLLELLKSAGLDDKIQINTSFTNPVNKATTPRKSGWGKGLFSNVAADFDGMLVGN